MNGVENLLFACNAVLPTFAIVLLGSSLKKIGVLQDTLIQQGNTLCFQVLFPILVFFNIYAAEKINISYLKLVVIALTVIAVSLLILLFVVPRVTTDRRRMSVLIQSIYRGNFMLYGLPFSQVLGGADSAAMATSIMAATLPVLNIIGVFVYSFFSEVKGKPDLKGAAVQSVKNHILWGVIIGFVFRMLNIPLAFLLLGGQFCISSAKKNWKALMVGLGVKLVILPVVVLFVVIYGMGITGAELVPIFIFCAAPTAITNYQMAIQFDADAELAGDFLIYSMLFSVLTMFVLIYALRSGGWL